MYGRAYISSIPMAFQNTILAITSITHKAISQLSNPGHLHTTLVRDHRHLWSVTTSDRLKWRSTPLKPSKSFCTYRSTPQLQCMPEDTIVKHEKLVEIVRGMITNNINDVKFDDLLMVDALVRLGLDYHYEDEINLILEQCYLKFGIKDSMEDRNLFEVSLCFRILRQNGFRVSADIFEFVNRLNYDIKGLMELHEASHLSIKGENILDEAAIYSSTMLQNTLDFLNDKEGKMVRYTLENPQHKNITCFTLRNFSNDFDLTILKELAELDSTMVRSIRKTEIKEILRWWKDLGLGQDLNHARDQPLKWYIGPMVCLANPKWSQERIDLTKIVSFIYILDDIFDIYGSLDELTLLTEAVIKWEVSAIEQLPYYIKSSFKAVYDTTNEIASSVYKKYGFNPIKSLQHSWARLCEAFLVEAKWFSSGHVPSSEEYLKNGIVSSGVQVCLVHMFFLLGDGDNKENVNLIDEHHKIVSSISKILRLSDDLEADQDENIQNGHDGSYVKCYLMEHENCSKKIARKKVRKMISDAWKCLNEECLAPNPFSKNFLKGSVNLARLVPSMYGYNQKNSFDLIEEYVKSIM